MISTENFIPLEIMCLYQFKFIYPLENKNYYNYELVPINNRGDSKTFYVNKTIDCLSIKLLEGLESGDVTSRNYTNYFSLGLHLFNVTVLDNYKRTDSVTCSIYITKSCEQRSFVSTGYNLNKAYENKYKFTK